MGVGRRCVVLERLVMSAVVLLHRSQQTVGTLDLVRAPAHRGVTGRGRHCRLEAALEPAPRLPRGVEQISNVRGS